MLFKTINIRYFYISCLVRFCFCNFLIHLVLHCALKNYNFGIDKSCRLHSSYNPSFGYGKQISAVRRFSIGFSTVEQVIFINPSVGIGNFFKHRYWNVS